MRLTSEQVERTLAQFDAQPIPEDHPALPRLNEVFGDHTFFLDASGLNVVEPTAVSVDSGAATGQVIKIAGWSDEQLAPHPPEPTDLVVVIGTAH
ncbi:MAG TPA: hypothetical protein VKX28_03320 [Xanthobacteraceae bacterium]|nr:hypothetical protein [Xanthobacteraceae bacterium]